MNSLITSLLGGTAGAASSEARFSLLGLITGLGLIYMGHAPLGTNLVMTSVAGYAGARALPKASAAVADAVAKRSADAAKMAAERDAAVSKVEQAKAVLGS